MMPNSEIPWAKIAVFDINHGGLPIAKQLLKSETSVTVFDVYKKSTPEKRAGYEQEYGFPVSVDLKDIAEGEYDIVCLPIHLSPKNEFYKKAVEIGLPMITHHEMTGRLLRSDPRLLNIHLVEITGVRGKTSTAVLLAQMLSFKNSVVLHTSEGLTYWKGGQSERIESGIGISITPAHIPDLIDLTFERKYIPDTMIFEVSLGFTGAQDIGILTKAKPDYRIADGTLSSTDAKTRMISRSKEGSVFVIHYDDLKTVENYIRKDQERIVFDDSGTAVEDNTPTDIYLNLNIGPDNEPVVDIESSRTGIFFRAAIHSGYDVNSYTNAMAAAVATALELDVPESHIESVISEFQGVAGRMREYEENGRLILDNSNSGLTIESAIAAVKYMIEKYTDKRSLEYDSSVQRDITLIIGEEEKTVCEGLDPDGAEKLINDYLNDDKDERRHIELRHIIPVGERFRYMAENNVFQNAVYAGTFKEGLERALDVSKEGDIIIAAVKCFR